MEGMKLTLTNLSGEGPLVWLNAFSFKILWTAPISNLNGKLVLNQVLKWKPACQSSAGWCRNFSKWQPTSHIPQRLKNKELNNNSKNTWRLLSLVLLICTASWYSKESEPHNLLIRRGKAVHSLFSCLTQDQNVRTGFGTQLICVFTQACSFCWEACQFPVYLIQTEKERLSAAREESF